MGLGATAGPLEGVDGAAAVEEDQRLTWAMVRQIWLNPAPGYVRRGSAATPVRQELSIKPAPKPVIGVDLGGS